MIDRTNSNDRYSKGTASGQFVFLAVVYPSNVSGDAQDQTRQVLTAIEGYLSALGSSKENVLRATVFFEDRADFDGINEVWDAWVVPGMQPARSPVISELLVKGAKVAIEVTATRWA